MSIRRLLAKKLSSETIAHLIAEELALILRSCTPSQVILFGSAARGDMRDDSELDFIVLFADQQAADTAKDTYYRLPMPRTMPVDILFLTHDEFARRSKRGGEGKIVYLGAFNGTT